MREAPHLEKSLFGVGEKQTGKRVRFSCKIDTSRLDRLRPAESRDTETAIEPNPSGKHVMLRAGKPRRKRISTVSQFFFVCFPPTKTGIGNRDFFA